MRPNALVVIACSISAPAAANASMGAAACVGVSCDGAGVRLELGLGSVAATVALGYASVAAFPSIALGGRWRSSERGDGLVVAMQGLVAVPEWSDSEVEIRMTHEIDVVMSLSVGWRWYRGGAFIEAGAGPAVSMAWTEEAHETSEVRTRTRWRFGAFPADGDLSWVPNVELGIGLEF